jgi:MFS family permease
MKDGYIRANAVLFVTLFGHGLATALLSVYLVQKGIGLENIGLIFAVGAIVAGLLRVPIGILVDCFGRKWFMLLGLVGYPLYSIGLIYSTLVAHFVILNLMIELFAAVFWTAHSAYIFDMISKGKEGIGMAGRNIMMYLPSVFAPLTAGILATVYGFTSLFIISAAIASMGIFMAFALKDSTKVVKRLSVAVIREEYQNIASIPGLKQIALIIFFSDFLIVFWSIFMPIWLIQQGFSLEAIGSILTINILIGTLMQIPLGKAIDKLPIRNLIIPGFLLFSLAGFVFFIAKNYFHYLLSRVLVGMGSDLNSWPAVGMLAKLTPKQEHGATTALVFGIDKAIMGFAAVAAGLLTAKYGIPAVLTATGVLTLIAAIVLVPNKLLKQKGTQFHKLHHISSAALNVAHKYHK